MDNLHRLQLNFSPQKCNVLNYEIIILIRINCNFLGLNMFRFIYFRTADQIKFGPLTKS